MNYRFLNNLIEKKDLLTQNKIKINSFLIENNKSQIEQLYNFYNSNSNLLYVNGFMGTGKADIVNYSTSFLSEDVIILKYNCFNSTVLDDILLAFFQEFKELSSQNIITEPKVKTENFVQKINSYFSHIEKPFVIILDSFEAILEENRQEIIDFIFHLNSIEKVKTIIIGRSFDGKIFKELKVERVMTKALEKTIFENLLKSEKIRTNGKFLDEFYQITRGYYLYTALSARLMKNKKIYLEDFMTNLKNSFMSLGQYLSKESFSLIPNTEKNLFWFLTVIRHPVSIELLKKLEFYNKENLDTLIEDLVVFEDRGQVYVQDYLKNEVDRFAPATLLLKIRQYIIDLYQTQLPLKPLERDICISRQTMRKEIEFQTFFLPKKPKLNENKPVDINYLSYSNVFSIDKTKNDKTKDKISSIKPQTDLDLTKRKNVSLNIENMIYQDKRIQKNPQQNKSEKEILNFERIIELIKDYEKIYDYNEIINLCTQALGMKNEKLYSMYLPFIYSKMAHASQKTAKYDSALKAYDKLKEIYAQKQDYAKLNLIKLSIANIYYETYKLENAKQMFQDIANDEHSSENVVVRAYLQLAEIEEDSSSVENAITYYRRALSKSTANTNETVLSELYFKYALIMDDNNNITEAIKYYEKCIKLGTDFEINKFMSPSYANIANLYMERKDTENATKNYKRAYEIDKAEQNFEGAYDSASKLASIVQRKDKEQALEYFNSAFIFAQKTEDIFYIISALLALGDFYYEQKKDEFALKYYIKALISAKSNLSQDNIYKINVRINDVKVRLGEKEFESLQEVIYNEENEED